MRVYITMEVEVERVQGKFASRDAIEENLRAELDGANPGTLDVDDSEYEIIDWEISIEEPPKRGKR